MAKILPKYSKDNIDYRLPDQEVNPSISNKDFFISPVSKDFFFKAKNSEAVTVTVDFLGLDHLYWNKIIYTKVN